MSNTNGPFEIKEIVPAFSAFAMGGSADYFLVRIKDNPYKGSPWIVASTRRMGESKPGVLFLVSGWYNSQKNAYKGLKDERPERNGLATENVAQFTSVEY